jgi:hypothetical protein
VISLQNSQKSLNGKNKSKSKREEKETKVEKGSNIFLRGASYGFTLTS